MSHKRHAGEDKNIVKANFLRFKEVFPEARLIARMPVIPRVNDSEPWPAAIADFLKTVPGLGDYEFLAFHGFTQPKHHRLGLNCRFNDVPGGTWKAWRK